MLGFPRPDEGEFNQELGCWYDGDRKIKQSEITLNKKNFLKINNKENVGDVVTEIFNYWNSMPTSENLSLKKNPTNLSVKTKLLPNASNLSSDIKNSIRKH